MIELNNSLSERYSLFTTSAEPCTCGFAHHDVIPMDACHLLLGRPWQYDRHALYDGHENTYTFVKDGVKIKLVPLPANAFDEGKKDSKPIVSLVSKEPFKVKTKDVQDMSFV